VQQDVVQQDANGDPESIGKPLQRRIVAESKNFTRDLVQLHPRIADHTMMAERAKNLASEVGLNCETIRPQNQSAKIRSVWGVRRVEEPPALIVLRYESGRCR